MPVAVIETIALELETRLNLLVNQSTYNTDVIEVIRPTRFGVWTPKDLQIVLTQGASERVEELDFPGNPPAIARRQVFNIRCHIMSNERDVEAIDTIINTFAADVIRVVCTESDWYNFDGNAVISEWLSQEDIQADGGIDGVNVPLAITYRTSENNPYTVRS